MIESREMLERSVTQLVTYSFPVTFYGLDEGFVQAKEELGEHAAAHTRYALRAAAISECFGDRHLQPDKREDHLQYIEEEFAVSAQSNYQVDEDLVSSFRMVDGCSHLPDEELNRIYDKVTTILERELDYEDGEQVLAYFAEYCPDFASEESDTSQEPKRMSEIHQQWETEIDSDI